MIVSPDTTIRRIEYTDWFPAWLSAPSRIGVYQVGGPKLAQYGSGWESVYAFWNTEVWTGAAKTPADAYAQLHGRMLGYFFWRGLTEKCD